MIIDGIDVSEYISNISKSISKVYDDFACFISDDGVEHKKTKGTQTTFNISLNCVPTIVKNQLRSKNKKNLVYIVYKEKAFYASLRNFSATCINSNFWTISFALIEKVKKISANDKYKLRIYNNDNEYTDYSLSNDIITDDLKISIAAGGLPISGVLASQLSFSLDRTNTDFLPPSTSAKIKIQGFTSPDYFITSRNYTEFTASFTCTDRTIYLDLPFDASRIKDKIVDKYVEIDEVLNIIVLDCEFFGHRTEGVSMSKILYSDIENTTCRQVLQIISEASLGVFYCDEGNNLVFQSFAASDYEKVIEKADRTEITNGIVKKIRGLIAKNDESGQIFKKGNTSDAYQCLKISNKYVTEELADLIYNQVFDKVYREFSIEKAEIDRFLRIGTKIYEDTDKKNYYILSDAEIHITQNGLFAKLSAPTIQESEFDFEGNITRALKNKIEENKKYNGVSINKNGLNCEGVAGKVTLEDGSVYFYGTDENEKYGFATKNGGLTNFDGILSSSKEVSSVTVDTDKNVVTVNYSDGHIYTYSSEINKNGNVYNITDEKEDFQ